MPDTAHGKASRLHAFISRGFAVVASLYTAGLQLLSTSSLAYRAAGDSVVADAVNVVVIVLALVALADLVWRDLLGRGLILPRLPMPVRHQLCVLVYAALAGAFGIRAFIVAGDAGIALQVGSYYILVSALIAAEAYATAKEEREPPCPRESASD
jgi:hypothetical protein